MEASVNPVDRARLTARIERTEQRFLDVIEANADAIVVVDADGVVRYANRAAELLFDLGREDLVDTAFGFPLVSGETTELDLHRRDRPAAVVEMRVVESEWDGAPARIASLRDITERKEAERAARRLIREQAARTVAEESARRFRFLAECSATLSSTLERGTVLSALADLCLTELADWALVYVVGPDGQVGLLEVAHDDPQLCALLGELREDGIDPENGHPVLEAVRSQEPVLIHEMDDRAIASLSSSPRHLEILHELGVTSGVLVPLIARGRSVGAIGLFSSDQGRLFDEDDVTLATDLATRAALAVDNARLYHEARQADRAKSHLLAVISHDLKTPLSSIMGYSDLLREGVPEPIPEASRAHVDRIRTGAGHLLHLIDELVAFARLDAGHAQLRLEVVAIQDIVREIRDMLEPLAREKDLELILDLPDRPTTLRTDPGKLRQILVNLAGNAIKFTDRGSVEIAAEPVDGHIDLHVRDTGLGIAAEHLEQIFQPFWRVDGEGAGGSGLGLSVVQRLAATLGGNISVESIEGDGSTFSLSLPRHILEPSA